MVDLFCVFLKHAEGVFTESDFWPDRNFRPKLADLQKPHDHQGPQARCTSHEPRTMKPSRPLKAWGCLMKFGGHTLREDRCHSPSWCPRREHGDTCGPYERLGEARFVTCDEIRETAQKPYCLAKVGGVTRSEDRLNTSMLPLVPGPRY